MQCKKKRHNKSHGRTLYLGEFGGNKRHISNSMRAAALEIMTRGVYTQWALHTSAATRELQGSEEA